MWQASLPVEMWWDLGDMPGRRETVGSECKLGSKLRVKGSFTGLGSDNELKECGQEAAVQASCQFTV